MSATYLPKRQATLAKRVNGGVWMAFGSYSTQHLAREAAALNRRFHLDRCPNDAVEYSIDGERVS